MHGHSHEHQHELGDVPVLDIGGDVGALLVYLDRPPSSGELEARPLGRPAARFHTGVHRRDLGGTCTYIALYPEVERGTYEILGSDLEPIAVVDVIGGDVRELDLRR